MLVLSCSHGSAVDPVIPSDSILRDPLLKSVDNRRFTWGLYDVRISEDLSTVEITPMRTAEMHFNTVRLMETIVCTDCISIGNLRVYNPSEISVDVTLKHPFHGLANYTGFDVRGILIAGSDYTFPISGRKIAYGDDKLSILNADGYTSLFNPTEFPSSSPNPPILEYIPGNFATGGDLSATLNPYLAFCEDQERRMFQASGIYTRTMRLRTPSSGKLEFGYAVDACWHPAGVQVTDPAEDFPPEANCFEAYKINLEYGSGLFPGGGSAVVNVDVYDHQGQNTIESVTLEAPLLFEGEVALSFSTVKNEECFQYAGVVENSLGTFEEEVPVLVKVTDTAEDLNLGEVDAWTVAILDTTPKDGWAVTWVCDDWGEVEAVDVVCDHSGNVYVTGSIHGSSVDLDPGPGVDTHSDDRGTYLSKFDSNGQYLWGQSWGGSGGTGFQSADCDSIGNVYVSGIFAGEVDFDPGPSEDIHCSVFLTDGFLCKYRSTGEYIWTKIWPSQYNLDPYGVHVDLLDCIFVYGEFRGSADFDPGPGDAILDTGTGNHAFICKLDPDGNYLWAHNWGDSNSDLITDLRSIDTDDSGKIFCTGIFEGGDVDFDPGLGECLLSGPDGCSYLSVFDTNGIHQWALGWNKSLGYSVAVDPLGFVYVGGGFRDGADFDPGPGEEIRRSYDGYCYDAYLSVFGKTGQFLGVGVWHAPDGGQDPYNASDLIFDIEPDGAGSFYAITGFYDIIDVDPGPGIDWRQSEGGRDVALMKIHLSGELVWVRTWGGINWERIYSLSSDAEGNIYGVGSFMDEVDFDPGPGIDYHESPVYNSTGSYLIKFPPSGVW